MPGELTPRDRVWKAALELALVTGKRFKTSHVYQQMDDPPSHKTIQRTLRAMTEAGVISHASSSPRYRRGPLIREADFPE